MKFLYSEWFVFINGFTSIFGFLISIITLFVTSRVNYKVNQTISKKIDMDFLNNNCKKSIKELEVIQENLRKDFVYNNAIKGKINRVLVLLINHDRFLYIGKRKEFKTSIEIIKELNIKSNLTEDEMLKIADILDLLIMILKKGVKNNG